MAIKLLFLLLFIALMQDSFCYEFCGVVYENLSKSTLGTVPLTSVAVHLDVRGLTVGILAELKYENSVGEPLESHFVFPLSDEAAIYRLEAVIGDRHLIAKVERREEAQKKYQEAVDAGKKAILLQNQKGVEDVFRLSLGNLPAYGTAIITIGYVQPIDRIYDDGILSITLPMVLNPRYIPHHELINQDVMKTKFSSDAAYIAVSDQAYKMTFDAIISLGLNRQIMSIVSRHESDRLDVQMWQDNRRANVTLLSDFIGDHDFQLLIQPSDPYDPMIYLEPRVKAFDNIWLIHDILAAWVVPRESKTATAIEPSQFEFWLVIDRSGSMYGTKIADAKSALSLLVKKLPLGCKFNIIGFGSDYKSLFPRVVVYDGTTAEQAVSHLQSIDANLGGTEILQPLKFIYSQTKTVDNERFVLLLTDGEVANTDEVIRLAQQNAATTRVFSIGIGEGASMALVNGVARVSGGLSAFVRGADDRLQVKVLDMLTAMTKPKMANATLEWAISAGGRITSLIPAHLPQVYADTPLFQYAIIERFRGQRVTGSSFFSAANLENCTDGCRMHFQLESDVSSEPSDTLPLHRLAAKQVLTALQDKYYDSRQDADREEAIAVSIATGVICDFTAMVAVDAETDEPVSNRVDKIEQESMMMNAKISKSASDTDKAAAGSGIQNSSHYLITLTVIFFYFIL